MPKYTKDAKPVYYEYLNLSPKEVKNIVMINWFRYKHKLPLIEVPPYDKYYHKQFNKLLTEKQ